MIRDDPHRAPPDAAGPPPPAAERPERPTTGGIHIAELDSLRGLAVLLVFLFHYDFGVTGTESALPVSPTWAFVRAGHTGVTLFFVLSGFLLSLPFIAHSRPGQPVGARDFYRRRALRILPMYVAVVLVTTALRARRAADLAWALPWLFFLQPLQVAEPLLGVTGPWWSLATEVQFYLVLPPVAALFASRWGRWPGWAAIGLFVGAWFAFVVGILRLPSIVGEMSLSLSIIGRGPALLAGAAAAWLWLRRGGAAPRRTPFGGPALLGCFVALALLLRAIAGHGYYASEFPPVAAWHLAEGILWAAILLLVLSARSPARALLLHPAWARLGLVSYSFYLLHQPVITATLAVLRRLRPGGFTRWDAATALACPVILATSAGISAITWRWIERPFLLRKSVAQAVRLRGADASGDPAP